MDEGVDPKDMCRKMVTFIDEEAELESMANPEIRALFVDWMEELEAEVLAYSRKKQGIRVDDLVEEFKISRRGANFLLRKLREEGKLH